jgi:hypothetical protein
MGPVVAEPCRDELSGTREKPVGPIPGCSFSFHSRAVSSTRRYLAPSAMARYFFAILDLPSTILRKPAGPDVEMWRGSAFGDDG